MAPTLAIRTSNWSITSSLQAFVLFTCSTAYMHAVIEKLKLLKMFDPDV